MGSGKTSAGGLAAKKLGMGFADTDSMVEAKAGKTIARIFAESGENHFRNLEAEVTHGLAGQDNTVIATGGGAVLRPDNMRRLRLNGLILNLDAPAEILMARLKGSAGRPLLKTGATEELGNYLKARAPHYLNRDWKVDSGGSVEETAERICEIAAKPMIRICACISGDCPERDMMTAAAGGASVVELRLDLMDRPDVAELVRNSPLPVIAADRRGDSRLGEAIKAGCDFVDLDLGSPGYGKNFALARKAGCRIIASLHDFKGFPAELPGRGNADMLKLAVTVGSAEDVKRLEGVHKTLKDVIVVPMGDAGKGLRMRMPLLGSYLAYCYVGKSTGEGQSELSEMVEAYRGMGLR